MADAIIPGDEISTDDREAMIDKIEADNDVNVQKEIEDGYIEAGLDDDGEQLQSTQDKETEESSQESGEAEQEETPEVYEVNVGGIKSEVSLDQLTEAYQKTGYAEQKLEEAAQAQDQLKIDQAAWLAEKEQSLETTQVSDGMTVERADQLASAMDDLNVGSDAERIKAAENILSMMNEGRGNDDAATLNTDAITASVVEQTRRQMQYDNASVKFAEDYQQIANDPLLRKMADEFMVEEAGTSNTYDEAYKKAGDRVTEWVETFTGKPVSKRALKEKLGSDPVSSGTAAKPKEVVLTEEEQNQAALIEIKEARGQMM